MKLLFLTSYFPPEVAASSYLGNNIRQALCDNGVTIELYTPIPSRGIDDDLRNKYKRKELELECDGLLRIHRFNLMKEGKNPITRTFRYITSCIKQLIYAIYAKDARTCDVMFVASTPPIQGAMAAFVKKSSNIPFVYNLQDIFPDSLVGTGLAKKGGLLWKIGRVIENFTYRNADKIIVISEDFKKNIMAKGVPEDKIVVVYNWVDQNAVVDIPREQNKLIEKYGLDPNKFYVTYCGNIGLTQNMEMLVEVAKAVEANEEIHFVLVGEGAFKKELEKIIEEKNIHNITLLPFQPYEDISHVFSLGDVGIIISKPGVGANSVPSKTWSIMSASRPVLANFDENEIKSILQDNECGVFTKAGDKVAFTDAIIWLYENREKCKEYGKNGRQFVMDNLTREVGTAKYVEVIKSVVNNKQK